MRRNGVLAGVVGTLIVASACAGDPAAPDASLNAPDADADRQEEAGDSATVALGETVAFGDVGISVTYVALEGDSRCPIGLTCVWEGDAEVRVRAVGPGGAVERVLHTTLEPGSMRLAGVTVVLVDVLPRPVEGEVVDPADTRIVVGIDR